MILGIFQIILWEIFIPLIVGTMFEGVDKKSGQLPLIWISGQMLLWAMFQVSCVPFILMETDFRFYVPVYTVIVALTLAAAVFLYIKRARRTQKIFQINATKIKLSWINTDRFTKVFWIIFVILLLFQLVMAVVMTYSDGDDAFYVAVSTITQNAETMYRKLPYTGGSTELDVRHGLAPFPIWISYLAKVSGIKSAAVAHVFLPLQLIAMTYVIFYLIADKLMSGNNKKISVFMVFTEILVLFGNYSCYTVENFMIARSRQGKAALGSIIIPMLIWIILVIMKKLEKSEKIGLKVWLLLLAVQISGCLCTTLGTLICCVLIAICALCIAFTYRKIKFIIPMALCCIPCAVYAVMYMAFR